MRERYSSLTPAYGKDYKTAKEVLADWNKGADFIIHSHDAPSQYFNKESAEALKPVTLNIRFNKITKLVVVEVK